MMDKMLTTVIIVLLLVWVWTAINKSGVSISEDNVKLRHCSNYSVGEKNENSN